MSINKPDLPEEYTEGHTAILTKIHSILMQIVFVE